MKPAFCGPCFGAGDTPANGTLSIRHATRNFANREGSKPGNGQIAAVALMDARSIAATARNGGVLTAATDIDYDEPTAEELTYRYDGGVYAKRCYEGFGKADPDAQLRYGPRHQGLAQDAQAGGGPAGAVVRRDPRPRHHHRRADPLRRDQLLPLQPPSASASSLCSRRVPEYVGRSKAVRALEEAREAGEVPRRGGLCAGEGRRRPEADHHRLLRLRQQARRRLRQGAGPPPARRCWGASPTSANEYATKRYRSNCINWGIVPFTLDRDAAFPYEDGDWVYVPGVKAAIAGGVEDIPAKGHPGRRFRGGHRPEVRRPHRRRAADPPGGMFDELLCGGVWKRLVLLICADAWYRCA